MEEDYEYNIIVKYEGTGHIIIKGKNINDVKEKFENLKPIINNSMIMDKNISKIEELIIEPKELYEPNVISFCEKISHDYTDGIDIIHIITKQIKKGKITGIKENDIKQYEAQLNKKFLLYNSWENFKEENNFTEEKAQKYLNDKVFIIKDYLVLAIDD